MGSSQSTPETQHVGSTGFHIIEVHGKSVTGTSTIFLIIGRIQGLCEGSLRGLSWELHLDPL